MGFSQLRQNSLIYILNRDGAPSVSVGTIVGVSTPMTKMGLPPMFNQAVEAVVDITAKVDGKQGVFQKVPAGLDVWEYELNGAKTPYTLATTKEGINAEIEALRQHALGVISSVEHNREVARACDEMLKKLNPEYAEKQRQDAEIAELKSRLETQQRQMAELIALLKGREEEKEKGERPAKSKQA
ncbi:MAG: hypothetical protein NC102_09265 [Clostridium sp.]|nr:hypothetical protein [Clostridium sp.]